MDSTYLKSLEPFFGAWYLSGELGEGSFGKVFEISSRDMNTGAIKKAALKVLSIPQNESELQSLMSEGMTDMDIAGYYKGVVQDVVNEYAMMDKLKGNRFVVNCEDYAIITRQRNFGWDILIRMELLNPLIKRLEHNEMEEREVLRLGIDLCHAIEGCENANIIHRDIKPENIFISDSGEYKLGDFGIARTIERTTGNMSKKGTYTYMAPEIYQGKPYGRNVDLYSIGMVLYRLMNKNRPPFLPPYPAPIGYSDKENALVRRMRGENLPAPLCGSEVTHRIIMRATAYNPAARYNRAAEMRAELELALSALNKGTAGRNAAEMNLYSNQVGAGTFGGQNYRKEFTNAGTSRGQNYRSEFTNVGTAGNQSYRSEFTNNGTVGSQSYRSEFTNNGTVGSRTQNGQGYVPIGNSIYGNGTVGGYQENLDWRTQNAMNRGMENDGFDRTGTHWDNELTTGIDTRGNNARAVPMVRTTPQNMALVLTWMIIVSVIGAGCIGLGIAQIHKYGLNRYDDDKIINAFFIPIVASVIAALASMFRVDAGGKDKKTLNRVSTIAVFSLAMICVVTELLFMLGVLGKNSQRIVDLLSNRIQIIISLSVFAVCAATYGLTEIKKLKRNIRMIIACAEIGVIMVVDLAGSIIDIAAGESAEVLLPNVITIVIGIAGIVLEILMKNGNRLTAKRIWSALATITVMIYILVRWFGPVNMMGLGAVYLAVSTFWCRDGEE